MMTLIAGGSVYYTFYQMYQPVQVIVPAVDIPKETLITQEHITTKNISRHSKHPRAITCKDQVLGKFNTVPLYKGEQLLSDRLKEDINIIDLGIFKQLKPNETFVVFNSNEADWPAGVSEGDRVTMVVIDEAGSRVLATNIPVLATVTQKGIMGAALQPGVTEFREITLIFNRDIVGEVLNSKVNSQAIFFIPDHPNFILLQKPEVIEKEVTVNE